LWFERCCSEAGEEVDSEGAAAIVRAPWTGPPRPDDGQREDSDMFAVIRTGGKQYRVVKDDVIAVEKLPVEAGGTVELSEILMVGEGAAATAGTPTVAGAAVTATVVEQTRGDKVIVFKKRRRHNYRRKNGHRQAITMLRIDSITTGA